jgi:hypothetical protein
MASCGHDRQDGRQRRVGNPMVLRREIGRGRRYSAAMTHVFVAPHPDDVALSG